MTKCQTCAFRPGTEANTDAITGIKAKLCAENAEPFYCHENLLPDGTLPEGEEQLCAGFVDAMAALNAKGFYEADPDWRRDWRKHLLALIQQCEDDDRAGIRLDVPQVEKRIAESIAAMFR